MPADSKIAESMLYALFVLIVGKERADRWRIRVLPYFILALLVLFVIVLSIVVMIVV